MSGSSVTVPSAVAREGVAGNWEWIGTIVLLVAAVGAAFVFSGYHLFQLTLVVVYGSGGNNPSPPPPSPPHPPLADPFR